MHRYTHLIFHSIQWPLALQLAPAPGIFAHIYRYNICGYTPYAYKLMRTTELYYFNFKNLKSLHIYRNSHENIHSIYVCMFAKEY